MNRLENIDLQLQALDRHMDGFHRLYMEGNHPADTAAALESQMQINATVKTALREIVEEMRNIHADHVVDQMGRALSDG